MLLDFIAGCRSQPCKKVEISDVGRCQPESMIGCKLFSCCMLKILWSQLRLRASGRVNLAHLESMWRFSTWCAWIEWLTHRRSWIFRRSCVNSEDESESLTQMKQIFCFCCAFCWSSVRVYRCRWCQNHSVGFENEVSKLVGKLWMSNGKFEIGCRFLFPPMAGNSRLTAGRL